MKVAFENHTNIEGFIDIQVDKVRYECNAIIKNYHDLLEVGNKFDIGGHELTLINARYNPQNHKTYYVFENIKEAF